MDFSQQKFHPSSLHLLMTQPQSKEAKEKGLLSKTCQNELRKIYLQEKYKRKYAFESKYTERGISGENDGITLFCRLKKKFYIKNTVRIENDYLTGEPDLIGSKDIYNLYDGVDIKCCWSIFTFPFADEPLKDEHEWQNHGYMFLTNAKQWITAYCLVNATAKIISDEKKSVWWKMECPEIGDDNYDDYIDKSINIERNLIFNIDEFKKENPGYDLDCKVWDCDIPLSERVCEKVTIRQDEAIEKIKIEVPKWRAYLNSLNNL